MNKKLLKLCLAAGLFGTVLVLSPSAFAAENSSVGSNIWGFLGQMSLLQWIISIATSFVISAIGVGSYVYFIFKRERILYRNLKRPIMIIEPTNSAGDKIPGTSLEIEKQMIADNGFLRVSKEVSSYQTFNPNNNHCLVVIGYHKDMVGLDKIIAKAEQKCIPIIVYTYGLNAEAVAKDDFKKFKDYPWVLYANFKITLLNSIFSTLATFPYYKN